MTAIIRYARWLFWSLWYLPQPNPLPHDLIGHMNRLARLRVPWWKFAPFVYEDGDGDLWRISLTDEQDYTHWPPIRLLVEAHIGQESGDIVGLTINVRDLRKAAIECRRNKAGVA